MTIKTTINRADLTRPPTSVATGSRVRTVRLIVGYAAIAGTIPYLVLKAAWLAGSTIGIADLAFAENPSLLVLNAVTAGMDALVILVAPALTYGFGQRLPAWLVLVPMWVGTGLLVPIALGLPIFLASKLSSAPGVVDPLEPWVRPMVYGGFAWQAVMLVTAFAFYARVRWPRVLVGTTRDAAPGPTHRAQVVLANGASVLAVATAALHLVWAFGGTVGLSPEAIAGHDLPADLVDGIKGLLGLVAVAGVLVMVHRRAHRIRFWLPVGAVWVGAGAMFSWGLWSVVNILTGTVLVAGGQPMPLVYLQAFAEFVAGLLLGVTALFLLAERRHAPAVG